MTSVCLALDAPCTGDQETEEKYCDSRSDCPKGQRCCMPPFGPVSGGPQVARCQANICPHEEICDAASGCDEGMRCVENGCYKADLALSCGALKCTGDTPICAPPFGEEGTPQCVLPSNASIGSLECRKKADCHPSAVCCVGITTRCTAADQCDGGDTPVTTCKTMADCPAMLQGIKITRCEPHGQHEGVKVCR